MSDYSINDLSQTLVGHRANRAVTEAFQIRQRQVDQKLSEGVFVNRIVKCEIRIGQLAHLCTSAHVGMHFRQEVGVGQWMCIDDGRTSHAEARNVVLCFMQVALGCPFYRAVWQTM